MTQARAIGVVLLIVALGCGITSTALDYWYKADGTVQATSVSVYFGLWKVCTRVNTLNTAVCVSWSDIEDEASDIAWLHGCQAMMVIGDILGATALLIAVFATVKHASARGAQLTTCIAGICYLIAAAVFLAKYEDSLSSEQTGGHLHAGFALSIVAGVLSLVPACMLAAPPSGYQTMS